MSPRLSVRCIAIISKVIISNVIVNVSKRFVENKLERLYLAVSIYWYIIGHPLSEVHECSTLK